jgi:hypothetical protein
MKTKKTKVSGYIAQKAIDGKLTLEDCRSLGPREKLFAIYEVGALGVKYRAALEMLVRS